VSSTETSSGPSPARIALGRWENEATFWRDLVERYRLPHLGSRSACPAGSLRGELAWGDELFRGVSDLPMAQRPFEVLKRTEAFLRSPSLRRIYFDTTGIASSATVFGVPSNGYFARKELELLVVDLDLFRKARFFEQGAPLWRNGATWLQALMLRNKAPLRLSLLSRGRQRQFLEQILEL
jgi:hypothetical protein